tara:strand:+ start:286 stop:807 length:522 start_codon:yes stop_codon:yes gene_type:complete
MRSEEEKRTERLIRALSSADLLKSDGKTIKNCAQVGRMCGVSKMAVNYWKKSLVAGEPVAISEPMLRLLEIHAGIVKIDKTWRRPEPTGRFNVSMLPEYASGYFVTWNRTAFDADGNSLYMQTAIYDRSDARQPLNSKILRWAPATAPAFTHWMEEFDEIDKHAPDYEQLQPE